MPAQIVRTKLSARSGFVVDEPFTAAVSLAGKQYYFVMPGSVVNEVVLATGASLGTPLGVAQNDPAAGGMVLVRTFGKTQAVASPGACNLNHGTFLTVGSHGAVLASVCGMAFGRWLSASVVSTTATATCTIFVNCTGFGTCVPATS